ncbi:MAG TPA: phosphopyruvate hydratase, partial [Prosthecobacter sp.]|nr:phosphopyruvate hydratase [Prosthecobacter sp.]
MKIITLDALQIFDSRGNPTVEVIATLEDGTTGHGLVPSGASTGQHEALELRDGDKSRFNGKSVFKALWHVKGEIAREVIGRDVFDQKGLDEALIALDGTPGKSRLGANAILGTSMAVAQAAANAKHIPLFESLGDGTLLPLPEIQIFGGGKHAQGRIDIQDFMIMALTVQTYDETLEVTANVFHAAAEIMRQRGLLAGVADEGGYWPMFDRNEDVFEALIAAIERAGYTPG